MKCYWLLYFITQLLLNNRQSYLVMPLAKFGILFPSIPFFSGG